MSKPFKQQYSAVCRGCGREFEQKLPSNGTSTKPGIHLRCHKCSISNWAEPAENE